MPSKKVKDLAIKVEQLGPDGKKVVLGVLDALDNKETTDIFELTNWIDANKGNLDVELFLFNNNFTPYSTRINTIVNSQIMPFFIYDAINFVMLGAGTGLQVRDLSYVKKKSDNVIYREDLSRVGRAETLLHLIENERKDIVQFDEREHEFKRIRGMVARFTLEGKRPFYIFKLIQQSRVVTSAAAWQFNNDQIEDMDRPVAFKVPTDNQVLVADGDIFIYNQNKFEKLFKYNHAKLTEADKKVLEFEKQYKFSVPNGFDGIRNYLRESDALLNKFLNTEIGLLTQDQIIETADAMQVELMTDDVGAIILMDKSDLNLMLDLINDNYYQSDATGNHYVAKSKKEIEVAP